MFCRRGAEGFISNQVEIVAPRERVYPIVHRVYDGAYAESFIAQHLAHILLPEFDRSVGIAPRYLKVKRNETIAWVPREQNDFCSAKLPSRHQIFAAQSVPEIAFCPVLEQIVRKNQPGNTWLAVTFRPQRKLKAEALAEECADKSASQGPPAFRYATKSGHPAERLRATAPKVTACTPRT